MAEDGSLPDVSIFLAFCKASLETPRASYSFDDSTTRTVSHALHTRGAFNGLLSIPSFHEE